MAMGPLKCWQAPTMRSTGRTMRVAWRAKMSKPYLPGLSKQDFKLARSQKPWDKQRLTALNQSTHA
eukprot:11179095-Lingulodinium_polyedra.AAC.1